MRARALLLLCLLLTVLPQVSFGHDLSRAARKVLADSAALLGEGRHAEALASLREYVDTHPEDTAPLVHLQLGNALMMGGDPAGAEAEYARCLDSEPGQPLALRNRGHALWDLERFGEAAGSFEKAHAVVVPPDDELLRQAAMAWYRAGNPGRCVSIMEPFVSEGSPEREWVELHVHALVELERYADARQCLRGAVARNPGDPALWEAMSVVCRLAGRHAEAASAMEIQFALAAPEPARWRELSDLFAWLGFYARAARALERAAGARPAQEDARRLVSLWTTAGDADRALAAMRHLPGEGSEPAMVAARARVLCGSGRLDDARDTLAARQCGDSLECAGAWLKLGERYIRADQPGKAAHALMRAAGHARTKQRADALCALLEGHCGALSGMGDSGREGGRQTGLQ